MLEPKPKEGEEPVGAAVAKPAKKDGKKPAKKK